MQKAATNRRKGCRLGRNPGSVLEPIGAVPQPVEQAITESVEDVVPSPTEQDVQYVYSLPRTGEGIPIPIPVVSIEHIPGLSITEIPREFLPQPPPSPTS
jgi:hypothetical protein